MCPFLFIPHACPAFIKYALSTLCFVNHLVDPNLGVEKFLRKEGATEKGEVYFGIGD